RNSCSQSVQSPRSGTRHPARDSRSTNFRQTLKSLGGAISPHSPALPRSPPLHPPFPDKSRAFRSAQATPVSPARKREPRRTPPPPGPTPPLVKLQLASLPPAL